jgi:hypothetical protein
MPLARIITTSQEAVSGLVNLLQNRGYQVETVAPGAGNLGPVDLELEVETCSLEEAMRRVGARSDAEEIAVFLTANALSMAEKMAARKLPVGVVSSVQALPATGTGGPCVSSVPRPRLLPSPSPAPAEPTAQAGAAILQFPVPAAEIVFHESSESESGVIADETPQLEPEPGLHELSKPEQDLSFPAAEPESCAVQSKPISHLAPRALATARSFPVHAGLFLAQMVKKLRACKRVIRDFRFRQPNREAVKIASRIAVVIAVVWTLSLAVAWLGTRSPRQGWREPSRATSPNFVPQSSAAQAVPVSMETPLANSLATTRVAPQKSQTRKIIRKRGGQGQLIEEELFSSDVTIRHFRAPQPAGTPRRAGRLAASPENPALTAKSDADTMPVVRRYSDLQ